MTVTSKPQRYHIVVCGSGTVAHTTALTMSARGLTTAILHHPVSALPTEHLDERIFAITPPNQRFLEKIGFWQRLNIERQADIAEMNIHTNAHFSNNTNAPLQLSAISAGVLRLATMVEHRELLRVGEEMVIEREQEEQKKKSGATLTRFNAKKIINITQNPEVVRIRFEDNSEIETQLLVAADGAQSSIRELLSVATQIDHYGDMCIVGNFKPERFHRHSAHQWYYPDGVIATLPIAQGQISLAWSCRQAKALSLTANVPELIEAMKVATKGRLGAFESKSPVRCYPLRRLLTSHSVIGRIILSGDSAHIVHPMLGLGLNLGLGDVIQLVQHFASVPALERMSRFSVSSYEGKRMIEVRAIQALTHSFHNIYLQNRRILPKIASVGMSFLQKAPILKELMIRAITH